MIKMNPNKKSLLKNAPSSRAGFGLIEVMVATAIMTVLSLGLVQIVQHMTRSNLNLEQKQHALQLGSEMNSFLASTDNCTFNMGGTSAAATQLSELPKDFNQLVRRGAPNPVVVYQIADNTDATRYMGRQLQIRRMRLRDFIPTRDAAGNLTDRGEATFEYILDKTMGSEGSDSFRGRTFKVEIQLTAVFDPAAAAVNTISTCTAIGDSVDAIWIRNANNDIYYNGGDVGIGNTDPQAPLHVSLPGATDPLALFSGAGPGDSVAISVGSGANRLSLAVAGANDAFTPGSLTGDALIRTTAGQRLLFSSGGVVTNMTLDANGRLGLGTMDPTEGGSVNSRMTIRQNDGLTAISISNLAGARRLAINAEANGASFFDGAGGNWNRSLTLANGNLGINNTDPQQRLHITGNMLIDGTLMGAAGATASGFSTMSAGSFLATSDERKKRNITELDPQLKKLLEIQTYQFQFTSQPPDDKKMHYGVIAQKLEKQYPHLVDKGPDGILAVNYSEMVPLLIKSMQEMQQQIDKLEKKIQTLEKNNKTKKK